MKRRRPITLHRTARTISGRAVEIKRIETLTALAKQFGKRVVIKKGASR